LYRYIFIIKLNRLSLDHIFHNKKESYMPSPFSAQSVSRLACLCISLCAAAVAAHAGPLEDRLIEAAFQSKADLAAGLIEQGADVNARDEGGSPVLMHAVRPYGEKVVQLLIENGARPDVTDAIGSSTPLIKASKMELPEIVQTLLAGGADSEYTPGDGATALLQACIFGHGEIVRLLVENGADVNARDHFGFTPLKVAVKNKHADIAAYLRQKGANE
jgi:ankyrin repeat protein